MGLGVLLLLAACDAPLVPPASNPAARLLLVESDRLVPGLVGRVSSDLSGRVTARSLRTEGSPWVVLHVAIDGKDVLQIADRGNPDRAVVSPDGTRVAYVSAAGGLAGVWIARVADGARLALTNADRSAQDAKRAGSGPPAGWVAPPAGDELAFSGDALVWRDGAVALPEGWR